MGGYGILPSVDPSSLAAGILAVVTGRPGTLVCIGLLLNALGVGGVVIFHESIAAVYSFRILQGLGLATAPHSPREPLTPGRD